MAPSRRVLVPAVVVTVALGVGLFVAFQAAGGDQPDKTAGPRVVQPGAPGQSGKVLSPGEVSAISPPAHTAADTLFMQRMITHHAQALAMTALVDARATSPDLPLLAERIEISQRDEIAQMERWLADHGEVAASQQGHAGHDAAMPGMLTDEQLRQLEQARGGEFDRLFLQFMIVHHQGALAMVQELYATGGGLEPASDRFAREVNADQNIEIRRMQDLLTALN